ncbi:unnamed protein product [Agarophyton chilense]|eukprot:gb/GEZJ01001033.1/.p1 GENE.gb/GEZJ01001033.1/~~gb/GEZJ01001033.1/.p1  ORF type:complete len:534 (+),score=67.73 gb/GEZJ01001033.1/:485-2086(+)
MLENFANTTITTIMKANISGASPASKQKDGNESNRSPKATRPEFILDKNQVFNFSITSSPLASGRKHSARWNTVSQAELIDLTREQMAIAFSTSDSNEQEQALSFLTQLLQARLTDVLPYLTPKFIRFFCSTLRPNLANQSFVFTACRLISVLGKNSAEHCVFLSQNIDVELCGDLLRYHLEGSQYIHKTIIDAFTALLNANESHRTALLEPTAKGLAWIFAYLRRWRVCEEMQFVILEYFRTLLEDEEELKLEAVRKGLLFDLSYALECFPSSYRLKYLVIDLLITLTERSGEVRRQSIEEGHLTFILRDLQLLRGTPEMVSLITQAIDIYSTDLETRNLMGKAGFIEELLQTLRKMMEPFGNIYARPHRKLLCQVLRSLRGVVHGSQINRYTLMDATKLRTIKDIAQIYKFDENVVEAAFKVLETLCSDSYRDEKSPPDFLRQPSKNQVLEDIIRFSTLALSENRAKARYAELACAVLLQICSIGCRDAVFGTSPELYTLIPDAIQACFENEVVLYVALSLIRYTKQDEFK